MPEQAGPPAEGRWKAERMFFDAPMCVMARVTFLERTL